MKPLIRCGFGLGNRVAAIANALTYHDEISFVWRTNHLCPADHEEIFPQGIAGVEMVTDAPLALASRLGGRHCEDWYAARDRAMADGWYGRIFEAMAGEARGEYQVAIMARFLRYPEVSLEGMVVTAARIAAEGDGRVFVLADRRRAEIAAALAARGVTAVFPASPEMAAERQRHRRALLAYLGDWQTACAAATVVTHREETSVVYPARAAGRMIIYAGEAGR